MKLSLLFVFLSVSMLFAQQEKPYSNHSIGFSYGFANTLGPTYRYKPEHGFGLQASYLPMIERTKYTTSGPTETSHNSYTGLTFFYTFSNNETRNLFLYQGNLRFPYDTYKKEYSLNNSLGMGMEWVGKRRTGLNLLLGIAGYGDFSLILPSLSFQAFYKL